MVKLTMLMLLVLALFLLSHGEGNSHVSTSTDLLALLDFRAAITTDPSGSLSSWNTSIHYCKWRGVTCNPKNDGRLTALKLSSQGLSGTIAPSVGNLTFLHTLDLSTNQFFGQIPDLSNLQKMQVLNLSYNSLDGIVPDTLMNCSSLKELHLYHNLLKGAIPREIDLLKNLVYFALNNNNLTGTIPPALGNITGLQQFYLQDNQLEGTIPDELGQFSNISWLGLGINLLSVSIPPSLFNQSSLQAIDLGVNQLSGGLPNNMGDRLSNLEILLLGQNWLEGRIPDSLGNASMLQELVLQTNNFAEQIPSSFGKLSSLSTLDLGANKLEAKDWDFLQALGNCSALGVLALSNNQLQGVIPSSVGNLSPSLQQLILGGNMLSGKVPLAMGNLSGLVLLTLDENSLTGRIDGWIGSLKNLQYLSLRENNLSGLIPLSIGNLMQLIEIYLDNNEFGGPIPPSLGRLSHLLVLDLSHNNLQGNISGEIFSSTTLTNVFLSYNSLQGSIPLNVGNLTQLSQLDLSSNILTGEIPVSLERCQELQVIRMDKNFLIGIIPASFGNLTNLQVFNLSHNNLSGTIPNTLNDLELLITLDLSYNNLQGEIPRNGPFANATIVTLYGNPGLCGGVVDLHMPACHLFHQRVGILNYMVKILIPVFVFISIIMLIYTIIYGKKISSGTYLSLLSFGRQFPKVSYKDLAQATGNFSKENLIGTGSYGSVYKGKLTQAKMQVAIKIFDLDMRHADRSFISECEVLRRIRHRNLLSILTACLTIDNTGNDFKALIYEFMPNGNLDTWLHHRRAGLTIKCLRLVQRINIAADIAAALAYLHHDCGRPIVHCDVKPTNILLDDDMDAHLGDFGIASLVIDSRSTAAGHSGTNSSVTVAGTLGYIAPEYAQSVHASTCGDVYSFGIVLLEMLIGKRPTDSMFEDELTIISFVKRNFPGQILHIIDARLQEECNAFIQAMAEIKDEVHLCLLSLVQIALSCTCVSPRERMTMREVAIKLHAIRKSYVGAIKALSKSK